MIKDNNFNAFDFYLSEIVSEREILNNIRKQVEKLKNIVRNINWNDIAFEENNNGGNTKNFTVNLGNAFTGKVEKILTMCESLTHLKSIGKEMLFESDDLNMSCTVQIETFNNRIHISGDGIPRSLRGLGLGVKIYRAALKYVDYISSEDYKLYPHGKLIWNSLRQSDLFYTFFIRDRGFCFASNKEPISIIKILEDSIDIEFYNEMLLDEDFVNANRYLIESSSLSRYLL